MEPEVIDALKSAKKILEEWSSSVRPGSLGRSKNNDVIEKINKVLPPEKKNFLTPSNYDAGFVYPASKQK